MKNREDNGMNNTKIKAIFVGVLKYKALAVLFGILSVVIMLITMELIVPDGAKLRDPDTPKYLAIMIASSIPCLFIALWCRAKVKEISE